jgi:hypothetical protein
MQISGNKQLNYKQTTEYLNRNSKMIILDYYHYFELPAKIYTVASLACLVLDIIAALIFLIFEGKKDGRGIMYLAQHFIVILSFYGDVFLFAYGAHLVTRLPLEYRMPILKALFGFGEPLR